MEKDKQKEINEEVNEFMIGSIKSHEASLQVGKDLFEGLILLQKVTMQMQKEISLLREVISVKVVSTKDETTH